MAENFFGITDTGRIRDNNEDAFIAERLSNEWILACVIDGVGGYEGGEVAAEIARESIVTSLKQPSSDIISSLKDSLALANHNIYTEKQNGKGNSQMACVLTLALVDVENNQFYYAHVGDTRLYLLRDQSLVKVTKDHSFVGFLEDSGRLSEQEAMSHPKRNEINKALGFDAQIEVKDDYIETGSSPFLPGDILMFCSDGLTDMVNNQEMTAVLVSRGSLKQKGEALVKAANEAGGKDNITVVLVKNDKKPLKQEATKPVVTKKNGNNEEVTVTKPNASSQASTATINKKRSNTATLILLVLSLLLAGACYWLWKKNKELEGSVPKPVPPLILNVAAQKMADSLGLAVDTFKVMPAAQTLVLGDTLNLWQDSLYINGNGLVLQSDSGYNGVALRVTTNNKWLLLENITFRNFKTAILLQGKALQLKNVKFENCSTTIQRHLSLPSSQPLTGSFKDTVSIKSDTLSNQQ